MANGKKRYLTFDGETLSLGEWAQKLNIRYATIKSRLDRKLPLELVLKPHRLNGVNVFAIESSIPFKPKRPRKVKTKLPRKRSQNVNQYTINGETKSLRDWSEQSGIPQMTLRQRIHNGWPDWRILTPTSANLSRKPTNQNDRRLLKNRVYKDPE